MEAQGEDEGPSPEQTLQWASISPSCNLPVQNWKEDISAQLHRRDMINGKRLRIVSDQQSKLFARERELKMKNNTLELEVQKLRALLQKQEGGEETHEDSEVENYKRQLADFKLHQTELIKNMEEEVGRWVTKCQNLEVECEKLRAGAKVPDSDLQKVERGSEHLFAAPKPFALPRKIKSTLRAEGEITSVAFEQSGRYLAFGGREKCVKIFDANSGQLKCTLADPSMRSIMYIGFSSSFSAPSRPHRGSGRSSALQPTTRPSQLLIATSTDGAARLWNMDEVEASFEKKNATVNVKHVLRGHSAVVSCAAFSGDNVKVVTGSYDRSLKVWDLTKGYCIRQMQSFSGCNAVCIANEENLIFSGHSDGKMYLWDPKTGDCAHEFNIHAKRITSLAISPAFAETKTILSVSRDNTIKIFDLRKMAAKDSRPLHVITSAIGGHSGGSGGGGNASTFRVGSDWTKACFSPDGAYVACGGSNGLLFLWNIATTRTEAVLHSEPSGEAVHCCAWSGDLLAAGGMNDVLLWSPGE